MRPVRLRPIDESDRASTRIADATRALALAIRRYAIIGIHHAGSGHPGGSLSCADVLACLYTGELAIDRANPGDPLRDRLILSKGHAAPALYGAGAALGLIAPKLVPTLRRLGSPLQGHPHVKDLAWVETSTGSLAQGFSVGVGMAMGFRLQNMPPRVYCILGDGELQEGQVWEAAMCAAHHGLDNLCAVVDYNRLQSDDTNARIMGLEPLADKWRAFNWQVREVDGHDHEMIYAALASARETAGRPTVILAHTVKGKGVPYMENAPAWHGSVKMTDDQTRTALAALGLDPSTLDRWMAGHVD